MTFINLLAYVHFVILVLLTCGSLLTVSSSAHWFIRGWDFPRVQLVALGWIVTGSYFVMDNVVSPEIQIPAWAVIAPATFLSVWHGIRIIPYTPLFPAQAKSSKAKSSIAVTDDHQLGKNATLRVVVSNVEEENQHYELWMKVIESADPDVLVVLEVDDRWARATERLIDQFPHRVIRPQNNWYGMMLLSKYPIDNYQVRFLVQDDVPSIDAEIRLDASTLLRVVGVHPRPPEPIRGNDAVARDAELSLWGQELRHENRPAIILGDLNDVAWSNTTRLFLRTSGLLDPRRGRGFYNSYNAKHFFFRFPVDHVFVSKHFTISGIKQLPFVGSDHFPMQLELRYAPEMQGEHEIMERTESDKADASLRVERAIDDPKMNGDVIEVQRRGLAQG